MSARISVGLMSLFLISLLTPLVSHDLDFDMLQPIPEAEATSGSNQSNMNGFQIGSIYSRQTVAFPEMSDGFCEINDGAVWCWMRAWDFNANEAQVVPDGRTAVSINGQGMGPYCVILDDGSMSCFDYFDADKPDFNKTVVQLPNGELALTVGIGGVNEEECYEDSWACDEHNDKMACALTDAVSNNIYCFPLWDEQGHMGQTNTYGELGLGHRVQTGADPGNSTSPDVTTENFVFTPLDIDDKRATAISVGSRHACAIVESDVTVNESFTAEVYCWGNNAYGQLGNGIKSGSNGSIPYPHDPWKLIDGEAPRIEGAYNKTFIRGFGNFSPIQATVLGESNVEGEQFTTNIPVAIDVTGASTCVLLMNTDVKCWGGTFWDWDPSKYNEWYNQSTLDTSQPGRHANVPYSMSSTGHVQTLSTGSWGNSIESSPAIALYNSNTQACVQYQNGATYCWQKNDAVEADMRRNYSYSEDPAYPAYGPEFGTFTFHDTVGHHTFYYNSGVDQLASHQKRISLQEGWDSLNNQERMICGLMENGTAFCYDTAQDYCTTCQSDNTLRYSASYNQMFTPDSQYEMVNYGEEEWEQASQWSGEREYNERDPDNDGWPRMTDLCPEQAGSGFGCPDMDGDRVPDAFDSDKDGDGIPNREGDLSPSDPCFGLDSDGDGMTDSVGTMFDGSACDAALYTEDLDDDGDGVLDASDQCPAGQLEWISSSANDNDDDGCKDDTEDLDDDNDNMQDTIDACPSGIVGWTTSIDMLGLTDSTDYDWDGCQDATEDLDDDGDGIVDLNDNCPRGDMFRGQAFASWPLWTSSPTSDHDADGCHDTHEDTDDDDDGRIDTVDDCNKGDVGWRSSPTTDHDQDGCQDSDEDTDDDNDLVIDAQDGCPTAHDDGLEVKWWDDLANSTRNENGQITYTGGMVLVYSDRAGCADSDGDTVPDTDDFAPNNPDLMSMPAILTSSIAVGAEHSCAIVEDRSKVYCWGEAAEGAVGYSYDIFPDEDWQCRGRWSTRDDIHCEPRAVTDRPTYSGDFSHLSSDQGDVIITMLAAGDDSTCAIVSNSVIMAAGSSAGPVKCWGGGRGNDAGYVMDITNATNIAAGRNHACAILVDNSMRCWGKNDHGQLGRGSLSSSTSTSDSPVMVDGPDRSVDFTTCYNSGGYSTDYLHCRWGLNDWNPDAWGERLMDITAGNAHTCALTIPEMYHYNTVENVPGSIPMVSFGLIQNWTGTHTDPANRHVKDASNVWCWGDNSLNQLGRSGANGGTPMKTMTFAGGASFAIALDAYGDRTCAVLNTGAVYCWGEDYSGISEVDLGGARAKSVTVGEHHACIVDEFDSVQCWGSNTESQLGNLDSLDNNVNQIDAGALHTCAILNTNEVKCWGNNEETQLGIAWTIDWATPQTARGVSAATDTQYAVPPPGTSEVNIPVEPPVYTSEPVKYGDCTVIPGTDECSEDLPLVGSRSTPFPGAGAVLIAMLAAVFISGPKTAREDK